MLSMIFWAAAAVLACIGFVQAASWLLVRTGRKENRVYRIFPVGGDGRRPGDQMAFFYACLQWEANPSGQMTVLYDVGLDAQTAKNCEELARGAGVRFIRSQQELLELLQS